MMTPSTPFSPVTPFGPFAVTAKSEPRPRATEARPPATPLAPTASMQTAVSGTIQLARAAAAGDTRAMRDLLLELGPRVVRVVRAILGRSHQDVDDIVQQALIGFVQALPSFRGDCEPAYFASRVAARTTIAAARKGRASRAHHEDGVDVDQLTTGSPQPQPQVDAARSRRIAVIRAALGRIPPEQAEALALRIVVGWSLTEIAEATGAPLNTVRSRLRLAKTALRVVIDNDPTTSEELAPWSE